MKHVIVAMLVGAASAAHANPAPDPADAKRWFEEGTRQYKQREYAAAADAFERAYALLPDPLFLFDLGQSYRQMHECERARASYQAYLRATPAADNRAKVERFLVEMDDCVRRHGAVEAPPAPPPREHRAVRIAGLATGVAGVALLGGGVYFSVDASHRARELERRCVLGCDAADVTAIDDAGQRAQRRSIAFYAVGGAATAAGIGMVVWAVLHTRPEPIAVTPTSGGAAVTATFTF